MGYHKDAAEDILDNPIIHKPEFLMLRALAHSVLALCECWEDISCAIPEEE